MAKFHGLIGFVTTTETVPGVHKEVVTERPYSGDVLRNTRRSESGEKLNDDIVINNIFSIVSDSFAYDNFHTMRYIIWMGTSWEITNIEVQRPRLILTVGGVYNAP